MSALGPVTLYVWHARGGGGCPVCRALDGVVFGRPIGYVAQVGIDGADYEERWHDRNPSNSGLAHPNCKCGMTVLVYEPRDSLDLIRVGLIANRNAAKADALLSANAERLARGPFAWAHSFDANPWFEDPFAQVPIPAYARSEASR